jgi:hypothetical protein
MKLPAIQFYPADWRKDPGIQALSYEHRGIWFEILCLMHESTQRGVLLLNGKKMPEDALARILGLDKQNLTTALTSILDVGVASVEPSSGALMSRRMVRDENLRKVRAEAGKQGGNPVLLKQNPTTRLKQKSTPSSSSSSSTTVQAPALPEVLKTDSFQTAWAEWMAYRAERRLPAYKPRTFQAQLKQLADWGEQAAVASIRDSIRNQWQGLFMPKPATNGHHAPIRNEPALREV